MNENNTKTDKDIEMHYHESPFGFPHLALAKIDFFLSLGSLETDMEAEIFLCRRFWERCL